MTDFDRDGAISDEYTWKAARNSSADLGETGAQAPSRHQAGHQATLSFDLEDPEQRRQLQRMLAADDLCCVIWDVQRYIHELLDDERPVSRP